MLRVTFKPRLSSCLFTRLTTNSAFLCLLCPHSPADGILTISQWREVGVGFSLLPIVCVLVRAYCMCVQHIYCSTSVHALAVLKRGCDARCFTSKIEKAWRGDSVCLWGIWLVFTLTTLLHFQSCQNLSLLLSSFQLLPLGKKNQVCSGALPFKALYLCLSKMTWHSPRSVLPSLSCVSSYRIRILTSYREEEDSLSDGFE